MDWNCPLPTAPPHLPLLGRAPTRGAFPQFTDSSELQPLRRMVCLAPPDGGRYGFILRAVPTRRPSQSPSPLSDFLLRYRTRNLLPPHFCPDLIREPFRGMGARWGVATNPQGRASSPSCRCLPSECRQNLTDLSVS